MANKYLNPESYRSFYRERLKHAFLKKIIPNQKPAFLIVGGQKAGTSTLFNSLTQHPKLLGARTKEIRFFSREENYQKGDAWYINDLKYLKKPFKRGLLFEATPEYLNYPLAAERIYKFNINTKIIIILREQEKRAYSAWNMYGDFLLSRKNLPQIERFHNLFGKEQVLILGFKDLVTKEKTVLNKILRFFNLPPKRLAVFK